jgi:hypothetical protein
MADITASVVSWSTTESGNQPTDSTAIGAGLDDNLRAIQAGTAREFSKGSDLPSASTVDIGASGTSGFVDITGATTISSFASARAGTRRWVRFAGALTITHNATSMILPGAVNIRTQAGDVALFVSLGSGNWVCAQYRSSRTSHIDNAPQVFNLADPTKAIQWDASTLLTGVTRKLYASLPSSTQSSTYGLLEADYGGVIYCSSSFTLTLTTALGAGFQVWVKNTGTGTITLSPSSGALFFPGAAHSGAATVTLPYSGSAEGPYNVSGVLLQCDGTNWHVIATDEAHGEQLFTASGTWTAPAGVTTIWLDGCAQGGGGGGVSTATGGLSGGGGGGAESIVGVRYAVTPGTAYTVTLANTGGGGGVGAANGAAGSSAQFGGLVTLAGGGGGVGNAFNAAAGAAGGAGGSAGGDGARIDGALVAMGGGGGASHWGAGGVSRIGIHNGLNGSGYGAGGSGAVNNTSSARNGGNGSPGFFRVRW